MEMCSIFIHFKCPVYFCLINYTRNQFNTKVYPTERATLLRRTISGVMDNITILCERVVTALKYERLTEQLTNWYESLCVVSILSQSMLDLLQSILSLSISYTDRLWQQKRGHITHRSPFSFLSIEF